MDIGKNLRLERDGQALVLSVDATTNVGKSASGKTMLIATSSGNKPLGQTGAMLGFNLYVPLGSEDSFKLDDSPEWKSCGMNCSYSIAGGTLKVRLEVTKPGRKSSSGASTLLATSNERSFAGSCSTLNLNCYATDPEAVDVTRVEEASDFTFEETPTAVVASLKLVPNGKVYRRIAPIPGGQLKVTGSVEVPATLPAPTSGFVLVPGATNLEYHVTDGDELRLRFDPSQSLPQERTGDKHVAVASTARGATDLGGVKVSFKVLRPLQEPSADVKAQLLTKLRELTQAFLASTSPEDLAKVTKRVVRDAVRPDVERAAKELGVALDLAADKDAANVLHSTVVEFAGAVSKRGRE